MSRMQAAVSHFLFNSRWALGLLAVGLSFGLGGCKDSVDVAPETGTDYYPVAVGNFWTYAVADTTWTIASQSVPSVRTASAYQFRETITETFTDAAGQKAYRLVRAKRLTPADAWRNDSVFTLTANQQFVAISRSNARTVELIFPVKEGKKWSYNAFNGSSADPATVILPNDTTRQYRNVGQPLTTPAIAGNLATTYANTLTTNNVGSAAANNAVTILNYQQVYAKKVGPVFRRRRFLMPFNYTDSSTGNQIYVPGSYSGAAVRHETLIDYGPR